MMQIDNCIDVQNKLMMDVDFSREMWRRYSRGRYPTSLLDVSSVGHFPELISVPRFKLDVDQLVDDASGDTSVLSVIKKSDSYFLLW